MFSLEPETEKVQPGWRSAHGARRESRVTREITHFERLYNFYDCF